MARRRNNAARQAAVDAGFRSAFEQGIAAQLDDLDVHWMYEPASHILTYQPPPKRYLPDFVLENGVIIEAKGRFDPDDRMKHLLLREQHPDRDIRLVFQYDNTLTRRSKTRYTEWCRKHGIECVVKHVPRSWVK